MPYTDFEKTELLISEIQKHNVLWNKSHKKYKDRLIGAKAWAEVSKVTGITGKYNITIVYNFIELFSNLIYCSFLKYNLVNKKQIIIR